MPRPIELLRLVVTGISYFSVVLSLEVQYILLLSAVCLSGV